MPTPPLSPQIAQEAIDALAQHGGNLSAAAQALGLPRATLQNRVTQASRYGLIPQDTEQWTHPREVRHNIENGSVLIFSDCHYWPGMPTTAHIAAVEVAKLVKPRMIIANGDVFDGATTSRHDPFGWTPRPSVKQELEVCQERLHDFELAAPKGCELVWNVGNHCQRFDRTLAMKIPEFVGMHLTRLADHFPRWDFRISTYINTDSERPVMVKHRFANGVHAGYNNAMKSGVTMVTGHTHLLEAKPFGDYRGRRWGVQTGTLSDIRAASMEYAENSPSSACSGFAVLSFRDGLLLPPELCEVIDGRAYFRGEIVA